MKLTRSVLLSAALLGTASAAPVTITVLHTDDLHGHLEPTKIGEGMYGGYTRQTTLIKQFAAQDTNPLILSGGDTFPGHAVLQRLQGSS